MVISFISNVPVVGGKNLINDPGTSNFNKDAAPGYREVS